MQSLLLLIIVTVTWPPLPKANKWPPLPDIPDLATPTPAPIPDAIIDVTPEQPIAEITVRGEIKEPEKPKQAIIGYRRVCANGLCTMQPVFGPPAERPSGTEITPSQTRAKTAPSKRRVRRGWYPGKLLGRWFGGRR